MFDVRLADVHRGWVAESAHRGRLCVSGPEGVRLSLGEMATPVLPRSALKPFQVIAMLRSGLDLTGELLALAGASHHGQEIHLRGALTILERSGLGVDDFQHTADLPGDPEAMRAWLLAGRDKEPLAHNCSGKHAAMLRTCLLAGWPVENYRDPSHPLQQGIREVIDEYCGVVGEPVVDGCTAPAFATTLPGLAAGFGRISTESDGPARLVADAFRNHAEYTSCIGGSVAKLVDQVPGAVCKVGAEGVLAVGLPDGTGIALKMTDGMGRGRFEVMDAVLRALGHEVTSGPGEVVVDEEFTAALEGLER
ncbi:asparaginase [Arachnia propionica]|uniref:Asparaginase n=1 Tax=Arachnia propionica TaxID=1750 RepID=A0A3P1WWF8_9ACTN|nr:asparaginase [Arachnia propionica]RRD48713.1 asparaginase [Arachnia propionica]